METLAVEILQDIFTLACTDGGYTGCSLSLVSHYVRTASHAARFHSVALTSGAPTQVAAFAQTLLAQRALASEGEGGVIPRVRHLCIASAKRDVETHGQWLLFKDDVQRQAFHTHVWTLFRLVAPELWTLTWISGHRRLAQELNLVDIARLEFPLLEELTITESPIKYYPPVGDVVHPDGGYSDGDVEEEREQDDVDHLQPLCPRLTRLHIVFAGWPQLSFFKWARRAPHLTHLRLSNINHHAKDYLKQFKAFLDAEDPHTTPCPHLAHVLVEPCSHPEPGGASLSPGRSYAGYLHLLRHMRRDARTTRASVCVTAPPPALVRRGVQGQGQSQEQGYKVGVALRRDWLDRLDGRAGCWDVGALGELEEVPCEEPYGRCAVVLG